MSSDTMSHDEAIGQFCGVTGADEKRAKVLLEACDWNLELAVNMHVDTDDGRSNRIKPSTSTSASTNDVAGPSTSGSPQHITINESRDIDFDDNDDDIIDIDAQGNISGNRRRRSVDNHRSRNNHTEKYSVNDRDSVRPPIPPVRQVLVQHPAGYSSESPQRRYNTRAGTTTDVYDAFRDFQAEAQWQERAQESGEASSSDYPSSNKRTLQELFRPPLELMFRGPFVSARECGTDQNKWLIVNIQDGREFGCQILNRDVWSDQTVKDILKEHFIFWQVYHDSYEGGKYVQFYNVTSFPHVSIIDPRTGEQMKFWPTSLDQSSFCDSVIEFLTEHPSPDGSSDANKMKKLCVYQDDDVKKTLYDQSEEAQLEAAIRASLQETENSNPAVPHEEDSNSNNYSLQIEDNSNSSNSITPKQQPQPPSPLMPINPGEECKIALRFPDGSSLVKKFSNQERLSSVRSFIRREKGTFSKNIEFVAPPNKKLTEVMMSETLESLGLCPASRLEVIYGESI